MNIEKEKVKLQRMTVRQLKQKYAEVFAELSRSGNKEWLVKRILWGIQMHQEGDISLRARKKAEEIARMSDIRTTAPKAKPKPPESKNMVTVPVRFAQDSRLPMPGTIITRNYKGEVIEVTVLPDGFLFEGEKYRSLSSIAKVVSGSHCNGYAFFNLSRKEMK